MSYRIYPSWHECTPHCQHAHSLVATLERAIGDRKETRDSSPAPKAGDRILLQGGTVISMDPAIGGLACGDVLIEDDSIIAIAPRIDAEARVIDCTDKIVMPGFCDPHIHCWEGALSRLIPNNASSVAEDTGKDEPNPHMTRSYMHVLHQIFAPVYRPEDMYIGTLVTLLAAIDGGITTVCDNVHNSRSMAHSDASILALMDSGIRGVHAYGRPRYGVWGEQFPHDAYRLKREYFNSEDQLTTFRFYMIGRDTTQEISDVMNVRRDLDAWVTFDSGIGLQPLAELYADGRFDGRETINHGNFVSLEKRRILAAHGAKVNVCPRIESQFRFGEIPYQDWLDVGLEPALSNDNPATYAISMFSEMQALYAYQRARAHRERIAGLENAASLSTLRDVLRAATLRGAENCALEHKVGTLAPGKKADLIIIDASTPNLYPSNNAICTVAQGASPSCVETVFIGGRAAKWQGRLVGVDLRRVARDVQASREYLLRQVRWPLSTPDFTD